MELCEDDRGKFVSEFRFLLFKIFSFQDNLRVKKDMLCYYNVLVTKNGGKNSRFPEYHWVTSSMIYAFHPTTFFQLGV